MKSGENEKMYPKIVPPNAGMWTVATDSQAHTHMQRSRGRSTWLFLPRNKSMRGGETQRTGCVTSLCNPGKEQEFWLREC